MRPYPKNRWQPTDDALLNSQRRQFTQQRNQARWRNEIWQIDWEEWLEMWQPHWHQRGRTSSSLCMVREDYDRPWHKNNVKLIARGDHVRRQHHHKQRLKNSA